MIELTLTTVIGLIVGFFVGLLSARKKSVDNASVGDWQNYNRYDPSQNPDFDGRG